LGCRRLRNIHLSLVPYTWAGLTWGRWRRARGRAKECSSPPWGLDLKLQGWLLPSLPHHSVSGPRPVHLSSPPPPIGNLIRWPVSPSASPTSHYLPRPICPDSRLSKGPPGAQLCRPEPGVSLDASLSLGPHSGSTPKPLGCLTSVPLPQLQPGIGSSSILPPSQYLSWLPLTIAYISKSSVYPDSTVLALLLRNRNTVSFLVLGK
jgi:hypothetical protein